jgi:hypothetical protein
MSLWSQIRPSLNDWEASFWDAVLGVRTLGCRASGLPTGAQNSDANWYESKCYYVNWRILKHARLQRSDVLYDVGSGAGRVLCIGALMGVSECVGIELSKDLCDLARKNASSLRPQHAPIEIRQEDATLADYSTGSVFFFCNPFGAETTEAVLQKIRLSLESRPRNVKIIYVHLHPEHRRLFEFQNWLKLIDECTFKGNGSAPICFYEASTETRK